MEAVGLGCGVKAALRVNVELTVALTPIHRCSIEGVFALGTLNVRGNKKGFEQIGFHQQRVGNRKISNETPTDLRRIKPLSHVCYYFIACAYLLPVAVFPVTLRATQTGGGLCVVLTGATSAIVFITCVCMAITLTPAKRRQSKHLTGENLIL